MPASLELVRIALQAYASGDSEIALALAGPQVRWDERASRPDGDLVWGHDKVAHAMRRYLDGWETYRFELEDVAEVAPGKVVGICRERGKPKEGNPVDRRFGALWIVDAGKLVSWTSYLTPREAVRAAKEVPGPQTKPAEPEEPVVVSSSAESKEPLPVPAPTESSAPAAPAPAEPEREPEAEPEEIEIPAEPAEVEAPAPFDFEAPEPAPAPVAERPRKRALTKSEEQKRAARARAKLRKQSSRQTA